MQGLTKNHDLQLLMTYCWGCYGTPPSRAGLPLHALLINHYERGSVMPLVNDIPFHYYFLIDHSGASYPVGGASEIPIRIVPIIERAGGQVVMKAPVSEVLIDAASGRVSGVRVGKPGSSVDIHAPIVISDAGRNEFFSGLAGWPLYQVAIFNGNQSSPSAIL